MALLGTAALAMWWDMAPALRDEFEHWHSHEHFPERLALPGFERATRWRDNEGEGFFVLYELARHEDLASPAYLARLNAPTPWSVQLMPHHRNMVRSQARVLASHGGGVAAHALTLRLSPSDGAADRLRQHLAGLLRALPLRPGLAGAHLLQTDAPPLPQATREQQIRGNADRAADWILLVCGYDPQALQALLREELADTPLAEAGAATAALVKAHRLCLSMVRSDPA
jgi:hypothetical protein